jgi:predicted negative regulator of RcsB-dependent stress response
LDRELKRQIKQDEIVTGVEHAWSWTKAHQEQVKIWGLVALVVVVGGGAFQWFRGHRETESQAALAEALEILEAPVMAELPAGQPAPAGVTSYATRKEKLEKALAVLEGVKQRYGSMAAGRQAAYQAAICRLELGDVDKARQALAELGGQRSDALLSAEARLSLAELEARSGQVDKAVDGLRALAEDENNPLPRDYVLMRLGLVLEDARRADEAAKAYRRLAQDFPESLFAGEARRKADYLGLAEARS